MEVFCVNFKHVNELQELEDQELLDYVIWLKESTPVMEIQYLEGADNIPNDEYEYEFDEIKTMLRFDSKNHKMICPFVDEREQDIFQKIIFSTTNKKDRFPASNFINYIDGSIENELFGIVTFIFGYYKIVRKFSDYRFINKNRSQEQKEMYLFNYETKVFDQFDIKDKKSPLLEEYNQRKQVVKYIKKRLKRLDFKYLEELDKQLFYKRKNNTKEEILVDLQKTCDFLKGSFPQGMLVKKLFFNITSQEYDALLLESKNILERIEILQSELLEIPDNTKLSQEQISYFTSEKVFFKSTPEKSTKIDFGYFILEEEQFPNVAQIEKRNYLTDYPLNDLQQVVEELTDEEKLIQEIDRIFDTEELEEIEKIINKEENKTSILGFKTDFVNYIKPKKLPPEKRSLYADYFFNKNKQKSE